MHEEIAPSAHDWNQVFVRNRCRVECPACREGNVVETDVNIGDFLGCLSKVEMYLRVVGTKINGTVERTDGEVLGCLDYLSMLLEKIVTGEEAVYVSVKDPHFVKHVTSVLGAVEILLAADFKYDPKGEGLYFVKPETHHRWISRRAAAALRLLSDEIYALERRSRHHTRNVYSDLQTFTHEFNRLTDEYHKPYSYPRFDDATQWMRVRNFFSVAGFLMKDATLVHEYHLKAQEASRYLERVLSYVAAGNVSDSYLGPCVLSNCRFSEDLQLSQYLEKEKSVDEENLLTTPTQPSLPVTPLAEVLSPEIRGVSPGVTITRTPVNYQKKQAFKHALPSPAFLTREPELQYAGLLNVVQNCFMNCLLQAYFTCRSFESTLLKYPADWVDANPKDIPPSVKLIHRMQTVFSYLEVSSAACVNPEYVLESVGACNPQFMDGGQHDPHEFADALIDMVCKGFMEGGHEGKDALALELNDLVKGECTEVSIGRDGKAHGETRVELGLHFTPLYLPIDNSEECRGMPPGTPFKMPTTVPPEVRSCDRHVRKNAYKKLELEDAEDEDLNNTSDLDLLCSVTPPEACESLKLVASLAPTRPVLPEVFEEAAEPAAENSVTLYQALDQLCIDFKDDSATTAATLKGFSKLPSLLMFYLPARTSGYETRVFDYDKVIYLDRYTDTAEAAKGRMACFEKLSEVKRLKAQLVKKEDAKNKLSAVIGCTGLDTQQSTMVDDLFKGIEKDMGQIEGEVEGLRNEIAGSYVGVGRDQGNTFHLHAVIVHKHLAEGIGHYFSYALDRRVSPSRWIKFDDTRVTTVSEAEVFSLETRRNVYCLFYESAANIEKQCNLSISVPQPIRRIIEHEDQRWEQKIQNNQQPVMP